MNFIGFSWISDGFLWISMEFNGFHMDFHIFSVIAMDFQ